MWKIEKIISNPLNLFMSVQSTAPAFLMFTRLKLKVDEGDFSTYLIIDQRNLDLWSFDMMDKRKIMTLGIYTREHQLFVSNSFKNSCKFLDRPQTNCGSGQKSLMYQPINLLPSAACC